MLGNQHEFGDHEKELQVTKHSCECGAKAVNSDRHSHYCPEVI